MQSMDPAKVDGLACVLAEHLQVVVFTHDTRLPQALKYLRLPATVLTVDRRERSAVRVRSGDHPVKRQALYDAKALARTRDLPGDVVARALPGLCRTAQEAALLEPARRRLLGTGVPHGSLAARRGTPAAPRPRRGPVPLLAGPQTAAGPPHAQAVCLESDADPDTARRWSATWAGLSRACHYHRYELAPTQGELYAWRDDVERVIGALRSGRGDELPRHSAAVWGGAAVNGRQVPHVLGRRRRGHHSCHRKRALATTWAPSPYAVRPRRP